jgi:hypothetical protein
MYIVSYHAVTCNYPPTQLLHRAVVVVSGSQDSPPIEGQFITYTCPPDPGFVPTGPNISICMGNGEWEPDPGEVDCIGAVMMLYHRHHYLYNIIIQLTVEYQL